MKINWNLEGRTLDDRAEAEFRSKYIPFRHRIDPAWGIVLFLFFGLLSAVWLLWVLISKENGTFEKPLVHELEDPRILANFRDKIQSQPLLDGIYHAQDGRVYLAQKEGIFHKYDLATGLWETEKPFNYNQMQNPDVILLRSGTGIDPLSNRVNEIKQEDSVWGLTVNGGLVRCKNGDWEVLNGDSLFRGATGLPVNQEQIIYASVSTNKEWLAVGTKENGFGLYHLKTHTWQEFQKDFFEPLPSLDVTHIVWSKDRFWMGSPKGLFAIIPPDFKERKPVQFVPVPVVSGTVLNMDVDSMERVWILENRNCKGGSSNCLRLSRFDQPVSKPVVLIDETNIYPNLALEDLSFAQYWDDRLILGGNAGIYSYHAKLHSWDRHFTGTATTFLPFQNGRGFYFGFTGGIGLVSDREYQPWFKPDKRCTTWMFPGSFANEKITGLMLGKKNEVLAFGVGGKLFSLDLSTSKAAAKVIFKGERLALNPATFRSATAFGNIVLFAGEASTATVSIHNIMTRSYKNIPIQLLPEWMMSPNTIMTTSGGKVYAVHQVDQYSNVYRMPEANAAEADFRNIESLGRIRGKVVRIGDWGGNGIALLTDSAIGGGQLVSITDRTTALTGYKSMEMDRSQFLDAAPYLNGVMFATGEGLQYYDYVSRAWGGFHPNPANITIKEIVSTGSKLWASTRQGQLMELSPSGRFEYRIGDQKGFDIPNNQVSDVFFKNDKLYIAGNGWVNVYVTYLRRVTDRWKLPGTGNVQIIDIIGEQPLTLCNGIACIGSEILDATGGTVLRLSTDNDSIWALRLKESSGQKYLKQYAISDPFSLTARCYFSRPYSGAGITKIFDAKALPDENIIVSTDNGLKFYSPSSRSWFQKVNRDPIPPGSTDGEIHVMMRHIAFLAQNRAGYVLSIVNLNSLNLYSSCFNEAVEILEPSQDIKCFTIDADSDRMAYVESNKPGTVTEWIGGSEIMRTVSNETGPVSSELKRMFGKTTGHIEHLMFSDGNELSVYDLQKRSWTAISLFSGRFSKEDPLIDVDVESMDDLDYIIGRSRNGEIRVGQSTLFSNTISSRLPRQIALQTVYTPSSGFNASAFDLVDVQQPDSRNKNIWAFVFHDRIGYYDALFRKWVSNPDLSSARNGSSAPPLDAGWIKWNRGSRRFEVQTPKGTQSFKAETFFKNNKLIFEDVDALLPESSNRWCAANSAGIWEYGRNTLNLTDVTITFTPMNWGTQPRSAHNAFVTQRGIYDTEGKSLPGSRRYFSITIGDVVLVEDALKKVIYNKIKFQGSSRESEAFSYNGFIWDEAVLGLALNNTGVLAQSGTILHPLSGYTGFELLPGDGQVFCRKANEIYFQQGRLWFKRTGPSQYQPINYNPMDNRVLVDNKTWKWELRNGELRVRDTANTYGFKFMQSSSGFYFTSDILKDAAASGNQLVVSSEAFVEQATPSSMITGFRAQRFAPSKARNMDVFNPPGSRVLASIPAKDPILRFTRDSSGRIKKELKVKNTSGNTYWVSFDFSGNRFPFDVVNSITSVPGTLYVGTGAGLLVYSDIIETAIDRIKEIYDFRSSVSGPLIPVDKVGTPADVPGIVLACSSGKYIEKELNGTFRESSRSSSVLDKRLRVQTSFWKLFQNYGILEGYYKDQGGRFVLQAIDASQGHLPHDRFIDMSIFDGQLFTLSETGWVSIHSNLSSSLTIPYIYYDLRWFEPRRFILVPQDIISTQSVVPRGLYLQSKKGTLRRFHSSGASVPSWVEITNPSVIADVIDYADRPPILYRSRLRLLATQKRTGTPGAGGYPYVFEYRSLDGQWRPLPWDKDCIGIDRWTAAIHLENTTWAATSSGIVSFSRDATGNVILDPDRFVVVPSPSIDNKAIPITRMISSPLYSSPNTVILRTPDKQYPFFKSILNPQKDTASFTPIDQDDPVLSQYVSQSITQVAQKDNGFWEWVCVGQDDSQAGSLKARFKGEDLHITGGRFDFDGINSFVFFNEDRMEFVSPSGGWYRIPLREPPGEDNTPGKVITDFHVNRIQRAALPGVNSSLVKEIRIGINDEGQRILGLDVPGEGFIRVGKDGITGKTAQFPSFLSNDGFWRYMRDGSLPGVNSNGNTRGVITITSSKNPVTGTVPARRYLNAGRFTDDIVIGLPVSHEDPDGFYYLLPTQAGVLRLNEDFKPFAIHPKESFALPKDQAPSVVFIDYRSVPQKSNPVYLASDGFHSLLAPHEILSSLKPPAIQNQNAVIMSVEEGPQDFIRMRWKTGGRNGIRSWTLFTPGNTGESENDALFVNISRFPRLMKRANEIASEGKTEPWMRVFCAGDRVEFLLYGEKDPYELKLPQPIRLLNAFVVGNQLFLIGEGNIYEININRI